MAVDVTAGKKVEFGRPSAVGVGAVSVGDLQAASRTTPDRNMETIFMFIILSFIPIIDAKQKNRRSSKGSAA
jgi:hypothetical protein